MFPVILLRYISPIFCLHLSIRKEHIFEDIPADIYCLTRILSNLL